MEKSPTIDSKELERRRKLSEKSEANLRLEGLYISEEAKAIKELWLSGEIDDEERNLRTLALYGL